MRDEVKRELWGMQELFMDDDFRDSSCEVGVYRGYVCEMLGMRYQPPRPRVLRPVLARHIVEELHFSSLVVACTPAGAGLTSLIFDIEEEISKRGGQVRYISLQDMRDEEARSYFQEIQSYIQNQHYDSRHVLLVIDDVCGIAEDDLEEVVRSIRVLSARQPLFLIVRPAVTPLIEMLKPTLTLTPPLLAIQYDEMSQWDYQGDGNAKDFYRATKGIVALAEARYFEQKNAPKDVFTQYFAARDLGIQHEGSRVIKEVQHFSLVVEELMKEALSESLLSEEWRIKAAMILLGTGTFHDVEVLVSNQPAQRVHELLEDMAGTYLIFGINVRAERFSCALPARREGVLKMLYTQDAELVRAALNHLLRTHQYGCATLLAQKLKLRMPCDDVSVDDALCMLNEGGKSMLLPLLQSNNTQVRKIAKATEGSLTDLVLVRDGDELLMQTQHTSQSTPQHTSQRTSPAATIAYALRWHHQLSEALSGGNYKEVIRLDMKRPQLSDVQGIVHALVTIDTYLVHCLFESHARDFAQRSKRQSHDVLGSATNERAARMQRNAYQRNVLQDVARRVSTPPDDSHVVEALTLLWECGEERVAQYFDGAISCFHALKGETYSKVCLSDAHALALRYDKQDLAALYKIGLSAAYYFEGAQQHAEIILEEVNQTMLEASWSAETMHTARFALLMASTLSMLITCAMKDRVGHLAERFITHVISGSLVNQLAPSSRTAGKMDDSMPADALDDGAQALLCAIMCTFGPAGHLPREIKEALAATTLCIQRSPTSIEAVVIAELFKMRHVYSGAWTTLLKHWPALTKIFEESNNDHMIRPGATSPALYQRVLLSEPELQVSTFGALTLTVASRALDTSCFRRSSSLTIFGLLALVPSHRMTVTQLMKLLWPSSNLDKARGSLYVALSDLRKGFRKNKLAPNYVLKDKVSLMLNPNLVTCDVDTYDARHAEFMSLQSSGRERIDKACELINLYNQGIYVPEKQSNIRDIFAAAHKKYKTLHVQALLIALRKSEELSMVHESLLFAEHAYNLMPYNKEIIRVYARELKRLGQHERARQLLARVPKEAESKDTSIPERAQALSA